MVSVNKEAMKLVKQVINESERLGIEVSELRNGTKIIDMGVNCLGSWEAGVLFSRINMGNLGRIELIPYQIDGLDLTGVMVHSDQVVTATLASQIAGWKIKTKNTSIIGTGPARAQAVVDSDYYFDMTDYRDNNNEAVLCLQTTEIPGEEIADEVAKECGISSENIYLIVAPSASLVGSIQVAARSVEQTVHKMYEKGFPIDSITFARGMAPVAPVIDDELEAMGRINDALLYGGFSEFWLDCSDSEIEKVINDLVSKSSKSFGEPFAKLFKEADYDFFKMDKDIHAMAKVIMINQRTGNRFEAGEIHQDIIRRSYTGRVIKS